MSSLEEDAIANRVQVVSGEDQATDCWVAVVTENQNGRFVVVAQFAQTGLLLELLLLSLDVQLFVLQHHSQDGFV